jgi:hypothetical protein
LTSFLEKASHWFLHSGIQENSGGVARFYRSDLQRNAAISHEITGYAVSALVYMHAHAGDAACLEAGLRAARYLVREAWDVQASTFPFEPASPYAYFFDVGIIVRGLLAAWRTTGDDQFRSCANDAALSLAFDFLGDGDFHPIIELPEKQGVIRESRWSRQPGCYQLKSALAWRDLGDEHAAQLFESVLASSLTTHESFLRGEPDDKMMDRLHAYCYFLEALLGVSDRVDCRAALAWGIGRAAELFREVQPSFERSDVSAQLLRVRLIAHHLGAVAIDAPSACEEANRASSFQAESEDQRIDGGFWFGSRGGEMLPFINPVSTAFCAQALELWQQHQNGEWNFELWQLI